MATTPMDLSEDKQQVELADDTAIIHNTTQGGVGPLPAVHFYKTHNAKASVLL